MSILRNYARHAKKRLATIPSFVQHWLALVGLEPSTNRVVSRSRSRDINDNSKVWQKASGSHVRFPSSEAQKRVQEPSRGITEANSKSKNFESATTTASGKVDQLGLTKDNDNLAKPIDKASIGNLCKTYSVSPLPQKKTRSLSPFGTRKSSVPAMKEACEANNSSSVPTRHEGVKTIQDIGEQHCGCQGPTLLSKKLSPIMSWQIPMLRSF